MIDPLLFKRGMRRLASGVSLVTTIEPGGGPKGFAATSVTAVSAEPTPSLLVCVNRQVSCHGALHASGVFCVNVLSEHDAAMAQLFSSSEHRDRRFLDPRWESLATGSPAFAGALASFDCEVVSTMEVESHTIFVARTVEIRLWGEDVQPLLYVDGRFDGLRLAVAPTGTA
ncbi:flavin reductase family protein [Mangrovicella endophytica]|uniref:flavin reductase family protein n=1 Tax=Mangrovicella endophytica TaxID=2066697 RepID=UPI000C9E4B50|nr:flavin reductase family protein [Mangrovicella endophytica]